MEDLGDSAELRLLACPHPTGCAAPGSLRKFVYRALSLGKPARRTPGHTRQGMHISAARVTLSGAAHSRLHRSPPLPNLVKRLPMAAAGANSTHIMLRGHPLTARGKH